MFKLRQSSVLQCVRALNRIDRKSRVPAKQAIQQGGSVLLKVIRENASLKDHTLRDLAEMDHPYATRHGAIQIHRSGAPGLSHPEFRIHSQDGKLLRAIKQRTVQSTVESSYKSPVYQVYADEAVAEYAGHVINGTEIMYGRNLFKAAADSPQTQAKIHNKTANALKEKFSKLGIRMK